MPATTSTASSSGGSDTTTKNVTFPTPTNATEYAYAILSALGINPATHPNSVADLAAQINFESGGNSINGNNPLGSTLPLNGSTSVNSDGVQAYTSWVDGVTGAAQIIAQSDNTAMYQALDGNATISSYATALGNSDWEGGGDGAQVNKAYGMSVAARYGAMAKGLEGGFAAVSSLFDSYPWGGQNAPPVNLPGPGIGSIPAAVVGLGTTAASSVLDAEGLGGLGTLLGDLTSGTFWKRIGVFSLGAALTLVGLAVFISTTKPGQKATSDAAVAALALA